MLPEEQTGKSTNKETTLRTHPHLQPQNNISHRLFNSILSNPAHVLHHLLPPVKVQAYDLRPRAHNRELPPKTSPLLDKNFFYRMMYASL